MSKTAEDGWPGGTHGFAMWFSGAPDDVELSVTEFWHPFLRQVCDGKGRSIFAFSSRGEIRWGKKDRAVKAFAHFMVSALAHLTESNGDIPFGYGGRGKKTLYKAFYGHAHRSTTVEAMFGRCGKRNEISLAFNEPMEHAVVDVGGSENNPVVRLSDLFHRGAADDEPFPLYIFWHPEIPNRPDWSLPRASGQEVLKRMVNILDSILQDHGVRQSRREFTTKQNQVSERVEKDSQKKTMKQDFLRHAFTLLFDNRFHMFEPNWIRQYLSDAVNERLPRIVDGEPYLTSVANVIQLCQEVDGVEDSYRRTLSSLRGEWHYLKPRTKAEILEYLSGSVLSEDIAILPPLTLEDREYFEIRWHEADVIYDRTKREILAKCLDLQCNLETTTIDGCHLDNVVVLLSGLLEEKVRIDQLQVLQQQTELTRTMRDAIVERAHIEFRFMLESLQTAIEKYCRSLEERWLKQGRFMPWKSVECVRLRLNEQIEPLKATWDTLASSLVE